MRFGSVCSGIEAASVAFAPLGWKAAWLAEIEPFPSSVLAHHYPDVPNLGDMTAIADRIDGGEIEAPDLLCGGCPCQSFSVAGLRKSLSDERGNLTLEFIRIADAIDRVRRAAGKRPAWVLYENVPGLLSTADNAFGSFLGGLCGGDAAIDAPADGWPGAGVVAGPSRVVAWRVLDAQHFGVAQRRRRVFVLALGGAGGWACADALLSITDSLSGHPAPSRQAREGLAPTLSARTKGGGGLGTDFDLDGGLIQQAFGGNDTRGPIQVATALNACASASGRMDFDSETFIAHSLRGEGFDASEDGTGRGTPLVPVLPFDTTQITSKANVSNPKYGDPCHPMAAAAHAPAIAFDCMASGMNGFGIGEIANPQRVGTNSSGAAHQAVMSGMQVRRLVPEECEALQGFPRGYTAVPHRGKPAADGPRYKALGNSWAVPCARWIGERIDAVRAIHELREAA